jgi:hypothetical protein
VLAAHGDHTLARLVVRPKLAGVPLTHGFAERRHAGRGRVLGEVLFQGADGGLLDVVGCGEVGLAGAEVDDVNALGTQALGVRQNGERGGGADAIDALGELDGFGNRIGHGGC